MNDNYMSVIRESHTSLLSRHELALQKRKIMSLDLDPERNYRTWNKMKRFVKEVQNIRDFQQQLDTKSQEPDDEKV